MIVDASKLSVVDGLDLSTSAGSVGEGGDLGRVVAEHAPPAPDAGAGKTTDAGPVEPVLSFQRRDPAFGTGAPFDEFDEPCGGLDLLAFLAGLAFA